MSRLVGRLWRRSQTVPPTPADPRMDRDKNPVVAAKFSGSEAIPVCVAAAYEGEQFGREVDEFFATFRHRPGCRLLDFINDSEDERLRSWFDWRTPEAEPKAFVRLMLAMMRAGCEVWEQPGIQFFLQGRWSQGPGPSKQSVEAISVLAQLIGKTITELYSETKQVPDAPTSDIKVLKFDP